MSRTTPYAELDGLLDELVAHSRGTFGADLVGVYLVGSFALGGADEHSDCDFLVVVRRPPSGAREAAVRALWAELPTRDGHWSHDLEGSYAVASDLGDNAAIGRPWLFVDHGHTECTWDAHCNTETTRWTLHEHGVTLTGPDPRDLVAAVPAELIRDRMRRDLPRVVPGILEWAPTEIAWTQRYLVATLARTAYSLATGGVTSKGRALDWAADTFGARWHDLLTQVAEDRARGWDPTDPPRPGSLEEALAFGDAVRSWGTGR